MSVRIPAKLKAADLTRFINKAAQLETARPVVAYWCEYWIVNNILEKGLHNGDPETLQFTTALMDKLEKIKADNSTNDAIVDDTAGQAYIEQFALETFQRAENTIIANKATRQTANTFHAAATFLELVNIWSPPDAETTAKIRYAKWNAVRITRALNQGKDPNDSNPKLESELGNDVLALDPNDPEVQCFTKPRQASVEDVPDEEYAQNTPKPLQSSIQPSTPPQDVVSGESTSNQIVPPGEPLPDGYFGLASDRKTSIISNTSPQDQDPIFPVIPAGIQTNSGTYQEYLNTRTTVPRDTLPDPSSVIRCIEDKNQEYHGQEPILKSSGAPDVPHLQSPVAHVQSPGEQAPQYQVPIVKQSPHVSDTKSPLSTDDVSIAKAQKHARWAISALNFEDAETAVRELREALHILGAH
ncbi:hypothetical protein K3495_g2761 [Podosphaera aphanis]|nr:hypothetical protein K3495_g2761 [Podosphaera aphanis]